MQQIKFLRVGLISLALTLTTGCNLFEFAAPKGGTLDSVSEGRQLMRDGEYQKAFDVLDKALQADPSNSELRYLHAKAALKRTGANTLNLATELSSLDLSSGIGADLPFMNREIWPDDRADALYHGIRIVLDDLNWIADGRATGVIDSLDIKLDRVIAQTVSGLLVFRDTNLNGEIQSPPDINLDFFFRENQMQDSGGFGDMSSDEVNDMLDQLDSLMQEGAGNLLDLLGGDTGLDEEGIDSLLNQIHEDSDLYRSNDGKDNDGDWDADGDSTNFNPNDINANRIADVDWDGPDNDFNNDGNPLYDPEPGVDEETIDGLDNDFDGLVDEDSHFKPAGE